MSVYHILLLSDLHIGKPEDENDTTRLTTATLDMPVYDNPFESLRTYINKNHLNFDVVVNLGDVANKGYLPGWNMGMRLLKTLSKELGCPLISTPGNHDFCLDDEDGSDKMQRRTIDFPTDNEDSNNMFWSKGYCLYSVGDIQFLIFNTESHLHKAGDTEITPDYDKLGGKTLESFLNENEYKGARLAITHHHVIPHSDMVGKYGANDCIEHADKFLNLLSTHGFIGLLHGHKHLPRFRTYEKMAIMACGSLSSLENIRVSDEDNHFHILTLEIKDEKVFGRIETYHFIPQKGWFIVEDSHAKVKAYYGIGDPLDIQKTAEVLLNIINPDVPILKFSDPSVQKALPELSFISVDSLNELEKILNGAGYQLTGIKNDYIIHK